MKLLLDTHTFVWWVSDPAKLSSKALAQCLDPANTVLFSVVSMWEIQIKNQLGKLTLARPLADIVATQQLNQFQLISLDLGHVLALDALPMHHRDPFDRILIAQAQVEDAVLVSHDALIAQYPVRVLW
jgi:PIN domain nuclease of toxin-antitoxin system